MDAVFTLTDAPTAEQQRVIGSGHRNGVRADPETAPESIGDASP
jgi:hypothetical protein